MSSHKDLSFKQLAAPYPATFPAPAADVLRVLPLSDLHIPRHLEATRLIDQNSPYLRRMDLVVLLGDMVSSFGSEREYTAIQKFIAQMQRPYTAVNGNHEFYFMTPDQEVDWDKGSVFNEATPEVKRAKLEFFRSFYGLPALWRSEHNEFGSFLFLSLDDVEHDNPESLSSQQRQWLLSELQVQPNRPAWIFCHAPLMLEHRLDMVYYHEERSACVEFPRDDWPTFTQRGAPVFWMSGHIHLRPDHYLFPAYLAAPNVWQVHCPDSWGYSRWLRQQHSPQRHGDVFSRHLEIEHGEVTLVVHHHNRREDIARQTIHW